MGRGNDGQNWGRRIYTNPARFDFTTNYFQAYNVALATNAPGWR